MIEEPLEEDRPDGEGSEAPPRERYELERCEAQAQAFEDAVRRGRLHHAWLLTGPRGVGKASFAYRAARRLLGARASRDGGGLGSDPEDSVCRLIASQSHPDLMTLEPVKRDIPVDQARRLPEFFAKTSGLGRFRVAILDAAEDLNVSGANALLKTLEEPSANGVLFLVSHAPGRLLPTIRSRCRVLRFYPWSLTAVEHFLLRQGAPPDEARRLANLARGSPGRAKRLASGRLAEIETLLAGLLGPGSPPAADLIAAAESFRGSAGSARFRLLFERLSDEIAAAAKASPPAAGSRFAELFEFTSALPSRADAVNLDRQDAFFTAIDRLSKLTPA